MSIFPKNPSLGEQNSISGKVYVFDGEKWEQQPLVDTFTNQLPVVVDSSEVEGVGRDIDHSFTIKELNKIEKITT